MKNKIKFYKFCKVASKVLLGILIALVVLCVAALIFRACSPAENNVAYASEADGIGVWEWNENPSVTYSIDGEFDFISNNQNFNFVRIGVISGRPNIYYSSDGGKTFPVGAYIGYSWSEDVDLGWNNLYKTIDIKTAPPAEFMTILRDNATYQGGGTVTYTVTKQATDCSIIGADTVEAGQSYDYQIAPNTGFGYPQSVQVFNAQYTYNNLTGKLTISDVTADVTIIARATGAENVVGYWKWDNTLSSFENAGLLGMQFDVSITADNTTYNAISFSGASSGGTNYDILFYKQISDTGTSQTRVYESQFQPPWVERYQTFRLNAIPNNRFLEYLQLNGEYLGEEPQYTVTGNNILNSLLTYADSAATDGATEFTQTIPFTTQDGASWYRIIWDYYVDTDYEATVKHRLYYVATAGAEPVQVWETETGWINTAYRFINFGNLPVEVSKDFLDWFTKNKVEETGYTIQGKYYFPNEINFAGGNVEAEAQFVDAIGATFWGMRWERSSTTLEYGEYSDNTNGYVGVYSGTNNIHWDFEENKTIDFGSVPQPVTKAFLDFINAVALTDIDVNSPLYQFGYDAGKIDGIAQGLEDAKEIVTPNSASWNAGYNKGMADAADNSILDGPKAIFGSVVDILNINLFGIPGFTVGAIVAIVVALGVLLFILKIIRG